MRLTEESREACDSDHPGHESPGGEKERGEEADADPDDNDTGERGGDQKRFIPRIGVPVTLERANLGREFAATGEGTGEAGNLPAGCHEYCFSCVPFPYGPSLCCPDAS